MRRIAWLTDLHLNFIDEGQFDMFLDQLAIKGPEVVLLGGDIAESHDVLEYLRRIDDRLQRPIYFVLGNHDYYFGSIAQVRGKIAELCSARPTLCYLTQADVISLTPKVALIGHDGWSDARAGDYEQSTILLNDYRLIEEVSGCSKDQRREKLHALGDEAAEHIRATLPEALKSYYHVVLLTHVPPLREASRHEGQVSDDQWAPHFTCLAMGETILSIMRNFPQNRLTVLCGHTHHDSEIEPLPNVTVITGGAVYGHPALARMFTFH